MTRPFYHEGMRELQDARDGRRVADALEERRLHREFWEEDRALIESAPFFFIATGDGEYMDCSIRAGDPGFVKILDGATLEWPEYDGNSMYRTLGNITRNPNVGLLFLRFDGQSRRLRISGRASIHGKVVRVACLEIFPNCPRYIPDLANGTPSPHVPREGHVPPAPEWKQRDYIRDILPADDPFRTK
jgi:hypothetical protein